MIEVDPAAGIGVYEYVALKDYIAQLFDGPVDVVSREGLKPLPPARCDDRRHLCFLTLRPAHCGTCYTAL